MDTSFIYGVVPPIITPVDENDCVDEKALREIIDRVIDGGVHGILVHGSNGEFYGLEYEEQERAIKIAVEHVNGRVPVYMGIGAITTKQCIKRAKMGYQAGAQALTMLPPMFLAPNEEELFQHFKEVAESTPLPFLLYNNPGRVGIKLSANLVERLADVPNIVGMKDTSGDMTLFAECVRRTRDKGFKIFAGKDTMILASLVYGAVGAVASTANVAPKLVVEIYDKFMAGDIKGALEAQYTLNPLRMAFDLASFPVVTKDAVNLCGLAMGKSILPNTSASEAIKDKLKAILKDLKDKGYL
ncbi:MAG: 4-hydroxy-tetrahydrodipicolinate synthase [Pelosinus sp.]|nr:4-hydroxy-tetrahydrodipicolinate synthase [Pelosinus sp.]